MTIVNLTQHAASSEQLEAGVVDLPEQERETLKGLLTFDTLPSGAEVKAAARQIAMLAKRVCPEADQAMLGGAPFLMASLKDAVYLHGRKKAVFAFSQRESQEVVQEDGSVRKVAVFRHLGFVEA